MTFFSTLPIISIFSWLRHFSVAAPIIVASPSLPFIPPAVKVARDARLSAAKHTAFPCLSDRAAASWALRDFLALPYAWFVRNFFPRTSFTPWRSSLRSSENIASVFTSAILAGDSACRTCAQRSVGWKPCVRHALRVGWHTNQPIARQYFGHPRPLTRIAHIWMFCSEILWMKSPE